MDVLQIQKTKRMMDIVLGLRHRLDVNVGNIFPVEPWGCHTDATDSSDMTGPGIAQQGTTNEYNLLVDFPGMTDVGEFYIDFDKLRADFVFESPLPSQLPQETSQLGVPNELFGFDRGSF
jgi:hypothetical protein